jgi:hypothetical protein
MVAGLLEHSGLNQPLAVLLVELDLVALLENAALVTTAKVGRGTVGTSTFTRSE